MSSQCAVMHDDLMGKKINPHKKNKNPCHTLYSRDMWNTVQTAKIRRKCAFLRTLAPLCTVEMYVKHSVQTFFLLSPNVTFEQRMVILFRMSDGQRPLSRMMRFFSNASLDYSFISHVTFFLGFLIEGGGYLYEKHVKYTRDPADRGCDFDDPTSYRHAHPVKVGISLQGVGVTLIVVSMLQMLRLDSNVGTIYVATKRCIATVCSFLITYANVTLAFGFGLHFTLKWSSEVCPDECDESLQTLCQSRHNKTLDEMQKNYTR